MGRSERVYNYIKWHQELRVIVLEEQFLCIDEKVASIICAIRGSASHHHFNHLSFSWRAAATTSSLSEIEAIMTNDEAQHNRQEKWIPQPEVLIQQVARKNSRQFYYNNNQQQYQQEPKQNNRNNLPNNNNQKRGRVHDRGRGRGRGCGRGQANNNKKISTATT